MENVVFISAVRKAVNISNLKSYLCYLLSEIFVYLLFINVSLHKNFMHNQLLLLKQHKKSKYSRKATTKLLTKKE